MSRASGTRAVAATIAIVLLAAICACAAAWRATGGRWYDVATPSMGRAAPVGTLLLTRPTSTDRLQPGDIITFHPPHSKETYSHRVAAVTPSGVTTRGDINSAADPWSLTNSDLIGRVAVRWWGLGWVLRGLPLLLLCLAVTALVAACVRRKWKSPTRVVGSALSVSFVAWVLHPWVGLTKLDTNSATPGVLIRAVSTGILPTRARALHGGSSVRLIDGQVGSLHVLGTDHHGRYLVSGTPSLSLWWWVAVVLICLSPLLWCLLVGLAPVPVELLQAVQPPSTDDAEHAAHDSAATSDSSRQH